MKDENANERDAAFFEREIGSFLPDKVFDAHAHAWRRADVSMFQPPEVRNWEEYLGLMAPLHPGRRMGAYFIPGIADPPQVGAANELCAQVVASGTDTLGIHLVQPGDDPEAVRQNVKRLGLRGLKCYRTYSRSGKNDPLCSIPDMLPQELVRVAHEEGWFITLHVFKKRAMAEPQNIQWVKDTCQKYPDMKLILAHSARGFNPYHNLEGLPQLRHLDNLYFDTSANCEQLAHQSIIRLFGHKRLMYGTDVPISHLRGRSFAVDDSFRFVYSQTPIWDEDFDRTTQPVLIGLEHLRSLKWACWSERLSDSQVEDIFWNNAVELFGLDG